MTKTLHVHDLSGSGAAKYGGRWNPKGSYVLYTASSAALAMLEWLAHAHERSMDESYSLATILLPENSIEILPVSTLPPNWKKVPPPAALADIGRKFIADGKGLALQVPSVLVPHDYTLVVNAQHSLMKQVKIEMIEVICPDDRLITKQTK
jgi:RES domain-containing protein